MKKDISKIFIYPKAWVDAETDDIVKSVRQWANREIVSNRHDYLKNYKTLFLNARKKLAFDIGFQGLVFPEESGGLGLNDIKQIQTLIMILKEAGRADTSIGFIHALEYTACLLFAGKHNFNADLCRELSQLFCNNNSDSLATVSLVLPGIGMEGSSDPLFEGRSIRVRIESKNGGYLLKGKSLRPFGNSSEASLFVVVCADPDGKPCVAFVPGDSSGLKRSSLLKKTGLDGCGNADIDINNVLIPHKNVINSETIVYEIYSLLNLLLASVSVGAAMGCYEVVTEWSSKRVIKAKGLIKDNPLCAALLGEVTKEISVAWLLTHNLANALANPNEWGEIDSPMMFSVAQMLGNHIQKGCMTAVGRAMELMASEGYAKEGNMEKPWRDIKTIQSYLCGVGGEALSNLDIARFVFDSEVF